MTGQTLKDVIEAAETASKNVLKGPVCSGKTTALMERCFYLMDKLGIPGDSILVLLSNKAQAYSWNSYISSVSFSKPRCCTFSGFVREELTRFYPLLAGACDEIIHKDIRPAFLSRDAAVHLISRVIQARREKEGIFASLVSSNERIAAVIADNILEAALEGISPGEIGGRLFEALYKKDDEKKRIFEEMDRVLLDYRRKCLELGVFDYGIAVEAYRAYLFKNEQYGRLVTRRIRHVIIDDIQESSFAELELATFLLKDAESGLLAYDNEFGDRELAHKSNEIIKRHILPSCNIHQMEATGDRNEKMLEFSESLYCSILAGEASRPAADFPVERHPATELRSEMLEQLGERICTLIGADGYKPSDIAIVSTYADIVTELVIGNILSRSGHKLVNAITRQNISDSPLCSSLLTFSKLCHPEYSIYPEKDKVKLLLELLFGFDPVKSAKIARKACNTFPFPQLPGLEELTCEMIMKSGEVDKYRYVFDWISSYKKQEKPYEISGFLQSALMEVFLSDRYGDEELEKAKMLIDSAEGYHRTAENFNRNTGRDFIEMAEKLTKASENSFSFEEKLYGEHVVLTTPTAFLAGPDVKKVLIICSLGSRNWSPARARELTNRRVLSATWEKGMVYTPAQEEEDNRAYLAAMIKAIIRKCSERLVTFESVLSENGYENDGILPEMFDGIVIIS